MPLIVVAVDCSRPTERALILPIGSRRTTQTIVHTPFQISKLDLLRLLKPGKSQSPRSCQSRTVVNTKPLTLPS
jgi:hypothetical protein